MEQIINKIKLFKDSFWFIVVFVLLVIIYFKNGTINNLREEVAVKPKIEYIYNTKTVTKTVEVPTPYEVIKWKEKVIIEEQDGTIVQLTDVDSARIAQAYIDLYYNFNETKIYDDVLMDSDTAYIGLYEEVTKNTIQNRKLTFIDRTPVVQITNTITKQDKTTSIVGGLGANIGKEFNSLNLEVGLVTNKNSVYLFEYDPINKAYGGKVILPIFNFKSK